MNQLRPLQQTPPESAQPVAAFTVRLTTAAGHTFTLCGNRDPAKAGADLLRDALQVSRARLHIQHSTQPAMAVSNGATP